MNEADGPSGDGGGTGEIRTAGQADTVAKRQSKVPPAEHDMVGVHKITMTEAHEELAPVAARHSQKDPQVEITAMPPVAARVKAEDGDSGVDGTNQQQDSSIFGPDILTADLWLDNHHPARKVQTDSASGQFTDAGQQPQVGHEQSREQLHERIRVGEHILSEEHSLIVEEDKIVGEIVGLDPTDDDRRIELGRTLLDIKTATVAPFAILNSWTEPGYSGVNPFLYPHGFGYPSQESEVYKYIASLPDDEIDTLRGQNIPGVLEIINLVKTNPNTFLDTIVEPEEFPTHGIQHEPVYTEINKHLIDLSLYMLQSSDENRQLLSLAFLKDAQGELGNIGYAVLSKSYDESRNAKIRNKILDIVIKRSPLTQGESEKEGFTENFSAGLLERLRMSDEIFPADKKVTTDQAVYDLFHRGIQELMREVSQEGGKLYAYKNMFRDKRVLRALERQPDRAEKIINLPVLVPELFKLLREGEPLYQADDIVTEDIFGNGNVVGRAREIAAVYTQNITFWRKLYTFLDSRYGEQIAVARSHYAVDNIPRMIPTGREEFEARPVSLMPVDQKRLLANLEGLPEDEIDNLTTIPFNLLRGEYKKSVFAHLLYETVGKSRDDAQKGQADSKNRALVESTTLDRNKFVYQSVQSNLDFILLNGVFPYEVLGESMDGDHEPFHVKLTRLEPESSDKLIPPSGREILGEDAEVQLYYLYDLDIATAQHGEGGSEVHMLGGIPSTEIRGVVLQSSEAMLAHAKRTIAENGFYIPIYDIQGNLLFTSQEYDTIVLDQNLSIPVEVWDSSFKAQRGFGGANEGGIYMIPTDSSPEAHYVKFPYKGDRAHLWNEQLTDNLYRRLGISVPDTQIVKVDNAYGHASRMLDRDPASEREGLGDGFIADVWVDNYDIIKPNNTTKSHGELFRHDNGGALLYYADSEEGRKSDEILFDAISRLENIKEYYSGLTQEKIDEQLTRFQQIATDEMIDQELANVRLNTADRAKIKQMLVKRRNDILAYYSSATN